MMPMTKNQHDQQTKIMKKVTTYNGPERTPSLTGPPGAHLAQS